VRRTLIVLAAGLAVLAAGCDPVAAPRLKATPKPTAAAGHRFRNLAATMSVLWQSPTISDLTVANRWNADDYISATIGGWLNNPTSFTFHWQSCDATGQNCSTLPLATNPNYYPNGADSGRTLRLVVNACNSGGCASAPSAPTGTVTGFGEVASGLGSTPTGYPQSDTSCSNQVRPISERRSANATPNNTTPAGSITWGTTLDSFTLWVTDRGSVDGKYTGTTDDILEWGACKWGHDEDLLRAVATKESSWFMSALGDLCGGDGSTGIGSYGIMQIKNETCTGSTDQGGWPDTKNETAVNVDYYSAQLRACLDGAFQGFLYDGLSVSQDIAAHAGYNDIVPILHDPGEDYVLWGCVGQWFAGNWWSAAAAGYITAVQGYYVAHTWEQAGF
jgi:autotransporter family porin